MNISISQFMIHSTHSYLKKSTAGSFVTKYADMTLNSKNELVVVPENILKKGYKFERLTHLKKK